MNQNPIKKLFVYIKQFKAKLIFSITSSIFNRVLDLMPPLLVGWVIDSLNRNPPRWLTFLYDGSDPWTMAIILAVTGVLIFAIESLFEWMYQHGFLSLAQLVQHKLRVEAYDKLQRREQQYFDNHRTGHTMTILNDDVNQLEGFLSEGFNNLIQLLILFIFSGVVLFSTSWQLATIGLIPVPLIIIGSLVYHKIIEPKHIQVRESVGSLNSRLENNIGGIQVIKSFTAEDYEKGRLELESSNYLQKKLNVIKYTAIYVPLIRMLVAVGFGGVLLVGSYWVLNDKSILTAGQLVLFSMMIQRVLWPLTRLGVILDSYAKASASAKRIFDLLDYEIKIKDNKKAVNWDNPKGEVKFEKVFFNYNNEAIVSTSNIINDLSFEIKPGKLIGVAGTTGAGKSTLIKLLLHFYQPTSGRIFLDGVEIRDMTISSLRKNISLVSQDVFLFYGTISENIAYALPDVTKTQIVEASKLARFDDFVQTLPQKYDSIVGERGVKLSGGQRQRLSIARALLKKSKILILDEATSSVDTETEKAIQQNLEQFSSGRTAIVIAHRLSTIRNAHKILVLDKGTLVEQGNHDELLKQNRKYADLWHIQIGKHDLGT